MAAVLWCCLSNICPRGEGVFRVELRIKIENQYIVHLCFGWSSDFVPRVESSGCVAALSDLKLLAEAALSEKWEFLLLRQLGNMGEKKQGRNIKWTVRMNESLIKALVFRNCILILIRERDYGWSQSRSFVWVSWSCVKLQVSLFRYWSIS